MSLGWAEGAARVALVIVLLGTAGAKLLDLLESRALAAGGERPVLVYGAAAAAEIALAGLVVVSRTVAWGAILTAAAFLGSAVVRSGAMLLGVGPPQCRCLGAVPVLPGLGLALQGGIIVLATVILRGRLSRRLTVWKGSGNVDVGVTHKT